METNTLRTAQVAAGLLLALAITQAIYTALYMAELKVPRHLLWGIEGLLFTVLAAYAGAGMVQTKSFHVGWSAIAFSAVLNVVQVSVGLTMFGPFREAAGQVEGLAPAAGAVVAFSFMVYYAAKLLLGLAAIIFGMAKLKAGGAALGGVTAALGAVALVANGTVIVLGRDGFMPSAVAGGSGVAATLLLALCLTSAARD
ncbi:thiamine biosynthesis protein ThiC [Congregibacter brevis]|uniref:Thiamine biosynthesis protein ThiC n=1 Tax=Congregibacter brevis TaxID=3081201 RepID=A0ABZ0I8N7_9GAMM|nr:thiamine biosynthesis protein ThiC [Congregibacter sp. IMCC45268]